MDGRIIIFDTETTGFNFQGGDRIIEIGAVEIIDGKITGKTFHSYVNPDGRHIPPDSYKVHKLSNEFLSDKPLFKPVAEKLLDFIGDATVIAHNGFGFDFPFINWELRTANLAEIPRARQDDTMLMAQRKIFGLSHYTLDALAKWFGVSLESRADSHGALIDAQILAEVFLELDKAESAESIESIMGRQHAAFLAHPKIGADFPQRKFSASAPEIAAHDEFMKCIINN